MTRWRWDRDWKNLALTLLAYAVLTVAGWLLWEVGRVVARSTGDAPGTRPEARRPQFWPRPTPPHGCADPAPLRASLCVRDGGHK